MGPSRLTSLCFSFTNLAYFKARADRSSIMGICWSVTALKMAKIIGRERILGDRLGEMQVTSSCCEARVVLVNAACSSRHHILWCRVMHLSCENPMRSRLWLYVRSCARLVDAINVVCGTIFDSSDAFQISEFTAGRHNWLPSPFVSVVSVHTI